MAGQESQRRVGGGGTAQLARTRSDGVIAGLQGIEACGRIRQSISLPCEGGGREGRVGQPVGVGCVSRRRTVDRGLSSSRAEREPPAGL